MISPLGPLSILEYNEMLMRLFVLASRALVSGSVKCWTLFDEKKGDPKVPKTVLQLF